MLRHGEEWGTPCADAAHLTLTASDDELARALPSNPGARVHWIPNGPTDLGRAIGRAAGIASECTTIAPMDSVRLGDGSRAVNGIVVGTPPHRWSWRNRRYPVAITLDGRAWYDGSALCVVIANGEYIDGMPLVPRAHPGDGAFDVMIIDVPAGDRAELRRGASRGEHVPHPAIRTARGRALTLTSRNRMPLRCDGVEQNATKAITVTLEAEHWHCFL